MGRLLQHWNDTTESMENNIVAFMLTLGNPYSSCENCRGLVGVVIIGIRQWGKRQYSMQEITSESRLKSRIRVT